MKAIALLSFALVGLAPIAASATDDVMIVYDGSNSMWGQIEGVSKIETARDVMASLVATWPQSTNLGLVAYGHRRAGDCSDIEMVIAPGPIEKESFLETVNSITPRGRTPLTAAVEQAAELLSYRDNPATVVLISDGVETCQANPCALAAQLERQGVAFTAHVIGFDLSREEHEQLACIAENTGGIFVPAENADELRNAMAQVQAVIAEPAVELEPEPGPEPEAELPQVTLIGPGQVTTGAVFDVSWRGTINSSDFITIVPAGSDEGKVEGHIRVGDHSEGRLTAPGTPGLYELRYVLEDGRRTLARETVEVVEGEVSLTGPGQVATGAAFDVSWRGTINSSDFITIVPAGSDEGKVEGHIRVGDHSEGRLTAPGTPGLYELRYVLEEGRRTLASEIVEVVEGDVSLTGPAQVATGAAFDVSWRGTINSSDFITIVPAGSEEGKVEGHIRVRDHSEGRLTAPGTPGLYELRYVLEEGRRTLASEIVEVAEAEVVLAGPSTVRAGAAVDVTWSNTINASDFITIVPAGSDEGTVNSHIRARDNSEGRLTAPDAPGLYEVRYVLEAGRRTLAASPFEVVAADAPLDEGAGLSVPATAAPGETITVSWTIEADDADRRITLAPADSPPFTWISAHRVGAEQETEITLPDAQGQYEVRFLDITSQSVLGRAIVAVGQ